MDSFTKGDSSLNSLGSINCTHSRSLSEQWPFVAFSHEPQASGHEPQAMNHRPQAMTHRPQAMTHRHQAMTHRPQAMTHRPQAVFCPSSSITARSMMQWQAVVANATDFNYFAEAGGWHFGQRPKNSREWLTFLYPSFLP